MPFILENSVNLASCVYLKLLFCKISVNSSVFVFVEISIQQTNFLSYDWPNKCVTLLYHEIEVAKDKQ